MKNNKIFNKFKKKKVKAFTLIEMLIVLLIISVLILLFVPNLVKQKDAIKAQGRSAVVKVVDSQAEIYSLNNDGKTPTLADLESSGQITVKQAKEYVDYFNSPDAKDSTEKQLSEK